MNNASYEQRRGEIATYFDNTAAETWAKLTSDAPVGRIRETVRQGRDRMRATLLDWLPRDLSGRRLLDAGCGTGALAIEAARRGAEVVAVDLSPTLIDLARERLQGQAGADRITFAVADMRLDDLGQFDHAVAMDSLIHYAVDDMLSSLQALTRRTHESVLFTFAPRTGLLSVMHALGTLFPRGNRAPAIEPVAEAALLAGLDGIPGGWRASRQQRVDSGFYISQACELVRL